MTDHRVEFADLVDDSYTDPGVDVVPNPAGRVVQPLAAVVYAGKNGVLVFN